MMRVVTPSTAARAAGLGSDVATGLLALAIVPDPFRRTRGRAGFAELVVHQQRADAVMRRVGPALSVTAAVADLLAAAASGRRDPVAAGLRTASALVVAGAVVLTVRVHVPINEQLRAWSPDVEVSGWRETWRTWERAHLARRSLVVAAAVLVAAASARRT